MLFDNTYIVTTLEKSKWGRKVKKINYYTYIVILFLVLRLYNGLYRIALSPTLTHSQPLSPTPSRSQLLSPSLTQSHPLPATLIHSQLLPATLTYSHQLFKKNDPFPPIFW